MLVLRHVPYSSTSTYMNWCCHDGRMRMTDRVTEQNIRIVGWRIVLQAVIVVCYQSIVVIRGKQVCILLEGKREVNNDSK